MIKSFPIHLHINYWCLACWGVGAAIAASNWYSIVWVY